MNITIKNIPDGIDEKAFVEFALVFVKRYLATQKQADIKFIEDSIEADFKIIEKVNGIVEPQ